MTSAFETDLTAAEIAQPCSYSTVFGSERWCDTHCSAAPCPFDEATEGQ